MKVFVECNPDVALVTSLGVSRKQVEHKNDKGRVCNTLESKLTESIGMVDEDPGSSQPTYISKLEPFEQQFNIKILLDRKRKNKLIIVCPRLEEWILDVARKANLNISMFGLSSKPKELHNKLGSDAEKLKPLIRELLSVKSPAILYLQSRLSSI